MMLILTMTTIIITIVTVTIPIMEIQRRASQEVIVRNNNRCAVKQACIWSVGVHAAFEEGVCKASDGATGVCTHFDRSPHDLHQPGMSCNPDNV